MANEVKAFLSRQTVTYTWTVVPITVEDRYKIAIDTTFESVVPVPVVTVELAVIDLSEITGTEAVVNVKVSNHGLIAANSTRLNFPTHPLWQFIPLIDQIGVLPANSSITVPLRIRRLAGAGAARPSSGVGAFGSFCWSSALRSWPLLCIGDGLLGSFVCGRLNNTYVPAFHFQMHVGSVAELLRNL